MKKLLTILLGITMLATVSAQTSLSQGGTGWNTSTKGDLIVGSSSTIRYTRLPIGSTGQVLWVTGGQPGWIATSSLGFPSVANFVTSLYASTTFPSFGYGTSTYYFASNPSGYISNFGLDFSTHNLTATGTLNVTGLATFGNASTTSISASTGAFLNALYIPTTLNVIGKTILGLASTTAITAPILHDNSGSAGANGNCLTSNGTNTVWGSCSTGSVSNAYASSTFPSFTYASSTYATESQAQKEAAKYATTAALPTVVYANGSSGVGATLTGAGVGALSLDSQTPSVGDRVLVKNQASTLQNGIYTVTAVGSVAAVFVMTRSTDFDQTTEIQTGDLIFVTSGTTQTATTWAYTGGDSPVIGTDPITFVQVAGQGSFTGTYPIIVSGTTISTGFSTSTINVFSGLNTFNATTTLATTTATLLTVSGQTNLGNASTTSISGTGLTFTSSFFTNFFGTNASTTKLSATNATFTSDSFLGGTATITNASTTNLSASGFTVTNETVTGNSSTTRMSISSGLTGVNGIFTGTLDVVGKTTLAVASSTSISASVGAWLAALFVNGTLDVSGKTTLGVASTTQISASTGANLANLYVGGTVDIVGKLTGTTASTTQISASTGANLAAIYSGGTLDVIGKTTLGNASTTNISASTGATLGALFVTNQSTFSQASTTGISGTGFTFTNGFLSALTATNASTTNLTVSGTSYFGGNGTIIDSTGKIGVGSSTPVYGISVASSTIAVGELTTSTSTNMILNFKDRNSQLVRIGTVAVSIVLQGYIAGSQMKVIVCNAPTGTAGAVTFFASSTIYYTGGALPTQTTTANRCDVWSFISSSGTSTLGIYGAMTPNF